MSDELREKYTPTTDEVIRGYRLPHRVVDPQRSGESMAEWLGRCSIESHGIQLESEAAARRWLARECAAALEDLALMWERTAHLHGDAMNDADWEHLKLWCASVRVYSEHKYGANRAAGTETGAE